MRAFRRLYGSNPLHLLGHLAALAVAAFALWRIIANGSWVNFLAWFLGAALLHDMLLLPVYSAVDRAGHAWVKRMHRRSPPRVPLINHVRVPALISGVLLLIFWPLILGFSDASFHQLTGHHTHGYLRNWLLITLALFAGSAVIYLDRLVVRRQEPAPSRA